MKYLVEVFWSDDDEGYIAVMPDLPGCSAFGETPEAAVHEIGDAIDAWIAACRTSGGPVPNPRPRPAKRGSFQASGQIASLDIEFSVQPCPFSLRVSTSLHHFGSNLNAPSKHQSITSRMRRFVPEVRMICCSSFFVL
jgi:antitoxin HicB